MTVAAVQDIMEASNASNNHVNPIVSGYEWRQLHDGVGKTPNVRLNATSWHYKGQLWVACGAGSGQGKSSEVWKFELKSSSWSRVDVIGDSPTSREGHSGSYIGNGKFVLFGGQGFAEPNKKLGRESDGMKTQTHWKRDVFNDLWQFDCETLKWTPIYPNGLSFPMGRRGHTSIYVDKIFGAQESNGNDDQHDAMSMATSAMHSIAPSGASSVSASHATQSVYTSVHSNAKSAGGPNHHAHSHHDTAEAVPENSLVVFGGAGIELSKYTEQLYNDVWLYSFDSNLWTRYESRGIEPPPIAEHKVVKLGDLMIVVGGISAVKSNVASASTSLLDNINSDVFIFNLLTSTWSSVQMFDHMGRITRLNMHGFTLVPDTSIQIDGGSNQNPLDSQRLIIYGGNQIVDSKLAATTKSTKTRSGFPEPVLILDLKDCTLTPLSVLIGDAPVNRYGHIGFAGIATEVLEEAANERLRSLRKDDTMARHASSHGHHNHGNHGGHHHQMHKPKSSHSNRSNKKLDVPQEEAILYMYGGCNTEYGGYCDPALYALVKRNGDPAVLYGTNAESFASNHQSLRPSSPDFDAGFDNNSIDSFPMTRQTSFLDEIHGDDLQRPSIWVSLQNKQNLSNYNKTSTKRDYVREPSNWEEMKLSLTTSHSERILESAGMPRKSPSRQRNNTASTAHGSPELHGRSSGMPSQTGLHSPSKTSRMNGTAPLLMLNDVDFSYRNAGSHNQGSPRSPWHLPSVGLNGTRGGTGRASTASLTTSNQFSWNNETANRPFTSDKASSGRDQLHSSQSTGRHGKHSSQSLSLSRAQTPISDVNPEVLAEEKRKRIQAIKETLQPVIRSKTKVEARDTFHKLFPKPYN